MEACRRGERTALIDTDPQGSLSAWWNARKAEEPLLVLVPPEGIGKARDLLKERGVRWLFVDTLPALTEQLGLVCAAADLVLIPVRPSPHDLRSVGATVSCSEMT